MIEKKEIIKIERVEGIVIQGKKEDRKKNRRKYKRKCLVEMFLFYVGKLDAEKVT